jgi:hypothetical protein
MLRIVRSALPLMAVFILFGSIYGQNNRFEGYSFTIEADDSGSCPITYLPATGRKNSIDIFIAGTNQRTPATGITACNESIVQEGSHLLANGLGQWCFEGKESFYDIKLSTGATYLWYPINKHTGLYNVKDFRPVTRTPGPTPQYVFSEPADYTKSIRNAVQLIAARQGGTLQFPDGDYVVGTTDGNTRDPGYKGITLPSGIIITGVSSNYSIYTTNEPMRYTASRIRLRNDNQAIFRIGGCTNQVAIRDLELIGNVALYTDTKRGRQATYGIQATARVVRTPNSSQGVKIDHVVFQGFEKGIYVDNAHEENCSSTEFVCNGWQFDYVDVDHCFFLENGTGIWIDTYNTDWRIGNSLFHYGVSNPPGDGVRIQRAGTVTIQNSYGGGVDYAAGIGGTFIYVNTVGTLSVISSAAERGRKSIDTNPLGMIRSVMINVIGSVFGDKVDLNGRVNYVSSGNFYLANTIDAEPGVVISSVGDRYCHDSLVLPGHCVDDAGKTTAKPGVSGGGRRMFETGQTGEDTGANRIEGRPNYFGYNVRIGDGLMQFDPNITFKDITDWAAGAGTRPRAEDGAIVYCKDCRKSPNGTCTQGTAGTDGAFAKRINARWRCD